VAQIPAGWYPDPAPAQPGQPPQVRYWDGNLWTEHVAPAGAYQVPAPQPVHPTYPAYPTYPPVQQVSTGPTTPDGEPLSGWWWRVLAQIIDIFSIGLVANIASIPAQIAIQGEMQDVMDEFQRKIDANPQATPDFGQFLGDVAGIYRDHAMWLFLPTLILTTALYAFFLRWKGATPGKLAVGLRVRLRDQPGQLPWSTIVVRIGAQSLIPTLATVVALLSGSLALLAVVALSFAVYGLLDPLWAAWDSKRQTIHDKLARTNVVRTR
jgi:uncharacterized RDD family membrane protein YckC